MWVGRSGAALQAWEVLELIICTGKQASGRWSCQWRRAFRWGSKWCVRIRTELAPQPRPTSGPARNSPSRILQQTELPAGLWAAGIKVE